MKTGKELIQLQLDTVPNQPGVYQMLDKDRKIIYIGKAKNLRNRLAQYTLELSNKNALMIALTFFLEYSITESESAALLLEAQLIKKFKPKFNILLKDDKYLPYIKLRLDHPYPQLLKHLGNDFTNGKFFGPFISTRQVEITLFELQKIFKLRSCTDNYFASRIRPCLQYEINRCSAPCTKIISKEKYDESVEQVKAFLAGKNKKLQAMLSEKMEELSNNNKFEEAAEIRDRIKALSYIQLRSATSAPLHNTDIIAIAEQKGEFCIQLFIYRSSRACGGQAYFPTHTEGAEKKQVLESFLTQFYQHQVPPRSILISDEISDKKLYAKALKELHHVKVVISTPRLSWKKKLIDNAVYNAEMALNKHLNTLAKNAAALQEVQTLFNLPKPIERIEVYDNSHIQGSCAVGAMIVVGKEGFNKKEYRLFTIKEPQRNKSGGDDYAMLREVLTRKLTRLKKEPERTPDLIIIDGGRGHLKVTKEVMEKMQMNIPYVCMAKGVDRNAGCEQFHVPEKEVFTLDKNLPVMKYLQILRDEAHGFAIRSHRKKRSIAMKLSSLDKIPGIGSMRKRALLNYFGSFKLVSDATIDELRKVDGISKELAKVIYNSLHQV